MYNDYFVVSGIICEFPQPYFISVYIQNSNIKHPLLAIKLLITQILQEQSHGKARNI